jgi:small-conductance mechanosensitive channel
VFLSVLTIVLLHAGVFPHQPLVLTGVPLEDAVHAALKIAWWLWAAWFVVGILRVFIVTEDRPRELKLIQDVLAGLIYLGALFAIISYVFDLPIKGLLATSGAIAIILGLALQSTLSDVFSAVVLNFSRPYRPGDWISIDGDTEGRVIEMNWRATHVLTANRDLAIVPNSTIAKAKIVNSSSPTGIHGMTVTVQLDAAPPPAACAEILQQAILNTRLILTNPAPVVAVKSMTADATQFPTNGLPLRGANGEQVSDHAGAHPKASRHTRRSRKPRQRFGTQQAANRVGKPLPDRPSVRESAPPAAGQRIDPPPSPRVSRLPTGNKQTGLLEGAWADVTRMTARGHELSPRLDYREIRLRRSGEVRQMSAIGTEETIDRAGGLVGLLMQG